MTQIDGPYSRGTFLMGRLNDNNGRVMTCQMVLGTIWDHLMWTLAMRPLRFFAYHDHP